MDNWAIRRAEPSDAEALATCIDAAYAELTTRIADLPRVSEGCTEDIAAHQVWVAHVGPDIIGGLVLVSQDGFLQIANVAVHPDHRGTGLGRAFMAQADDQAREQGYSELRLNTHVDIPENVQLYSHMGWLQTGRSGNKVSMKKAL